MRSGALRLDPRLDEIDHARLKIYVVQPIDLLHAGRTGDVHLRQVIADHIEADEVEPVALEPRLQNPTDFAIARGELRLYAEPAHVDVAAILARQRHAQRRSDRLAVEYDHAFVAVANLRDVPLAHREPGAEIGHGLENRVQIAIARAGQKDALAAVTVKRLHDRFAALLIDELLETRDARGYQRRRNHAGKIQRVKLFVRLAQARRMIEYERAPAVDEAQEHRRVEISGVRRRILAHEDRVERIQRTLGARLEPSVVRRLAHHGAAPRESHRAIAACEQIAQTDEVHLMPARQRLEHEDERGVLVLIDPLQLVHHECEFVWHSSSAPFGVQCGGSDRKRGKRRSLGTQARTAEADSDEPGALRGIEFSLIETALRSASQDQPPRMLRVESTNHRGCSRHAD